ncbi:MULTISPECIES: hypothetical protein [unclassified Methylobacterium]|uniref:hypothetical protein n=1 Tax=unclassified Methylobacterium TaxID=2615210 RepID=UPI0011C1E7E5|nr:MULTISPECIES: hypothetical protein [unclassified Methylobacterium]QEE41548.1 hypothetical protein FVA80_23985 [Methylobacterium sp. WL1]TXN57074.1 hypothetical protein FV241_12700 [Methylobacterium sp. WL2]
MAVGGPERYPYIPLRKAIERARQLWNSANDHAVVASDAVQVWSFSPKASGGSQTIAALKYYGLLQDIGANESRKVKLTEEARRYFLDERPEKHAESHKYFALKPRAFASLWEAWHAKPPSEMIARSNLKVDFGYSENAAREVLAIYADNLVFANLASSDTVSAVGHDLEDDDTEWEQAGPRRSGHEPKEIAMQEPQQTAPASRPALNEVPAGSRSDICNIPEGAVILSFPESFSEESLKDLEDWLDFQKNRLKRWVIKH